MVARLGRRRVVFARNRGSRPRALSLRRDRRTPFAARRRLARRPQWWLATAGLVIPAGVRIGWHFTAPLRIRLPHVVRVNPGERLVAARAPLVGGTIISPGNLRMRPRGFVECHPRAPRRRRRLARPRPVRRKVGRRHGRQQVRLVPIVAGPRLRGSRRRCRARRPAGVFRDIQPQIGGTAGDYQCRHRRRQQARPPKSSHQTPHGHDKPHKNHPHAARGSRHEATTHRSS